VSKDRFRTSSYLTQQQSIEKAVRDSQWYNTIPNLAKIHRDLRKSDALKANPVMFRKHTLTEHERINEKNIHSTRYDNGTFNVKLAIKSDIHRESSPKKWLTKEGFRVQNSQRRTKLKSQQRYQQNKASRESLEKEPFVSLKPGFVRSEREFLNEIQRRSSDSPSVRVSLSIESQANHQ
jgi:hypothetical protein